MGEPTIAQFSHMMNLSTPTPRIRSTHWSKRLCRAHPIHHRQAGIPPAPDPKYIDYYNISYSYLHLVMERAKQRFGPDDLAKLEEMLQVVSDELMPEIQLPE